MLSSAWPNEISKGLMINTHLFVLDFFGLLCINLTSFSQAHAPSAFRIGDIQTDTFLLSGIRRHFFTTGGIPSRSLLGISHHVPAKIVVLVSVQNSCRDSKHSSRPLRWITLPDSLVSKRLFYSVAWSRDSNDSKILFASLWTCMILFMQSKELMINIKYISAVNKSETNL